MIEDASDAISAGFEGEFDVSTGGKSEGGSGGGADR